MDDELTSDQRKDVRKGLMDAGFLRQTVTLDHGDGRYVEVWTHGANRVVITWGRRAKA